MLERSYEAHERLVGPARSSASVWRLIVGLLVIGLVTFGLNSTIQAGLISLFPGFWERGFAGAGGPGNTPMSMLILLASFGFVIIGVAVAAHLLQRRALWTIIGAPVATRRQFARALFLLVGIGILLVVLPPYDMGAPLVPNLDPLTWLLLLPFSLLGVLIQSSAEEILFRGYIQQQLAARFSSPFVWMVLPAALFALGHYVPIQAGDNAVIVAAWSGIFGLLMADLTARAGTLGPAIAVHFFNNVTALLFVSVPDALNGLSLFTVPFSIADTEHFRDWLPVDFAMMFVSWLAARLAIRR